MTEQAAGPLLDALGVTIDINPGQQLTEVLVIGKVGLDWITQLGLVHAARIVCDGGEIENVD